jgi:hypothetical protein
MEISPGRFSGVSGAPAYGDVRGEDQHPVLLKRPDSFGICKEQPRRCQRGIPIGNGFAWKEKSSGVVPREDSGKLRMLY